MKRQFQKQKVNQAHLMYPLSKKLLEKFIHPNLTSATFERFDPNKLKNLP